MAIERFFHEIKLGLAETASRHSENALQLMREGEMNRADTELESARRILSQTKVVDDIVPVVIERFDSAGIQRPPVEFFTRFMEEFSAVDSARQSGQPAHDIEERSSRPEPQEKRQGTTPVRSDEIENSPLAALITSRTKLAVIKLLFQDPEAALHAREIARRVPFEFNGVRRELESLVKAGVIIDSREKNKRYFRLNPDSPVLTLLSPILQPLLTEQTESKGEMLFESQDLEMQRDSTAVLSQQPASFVTATETQLSSGVELPEVFLGSYFGAVAKDFLDSSKGKGLLLTIRDFKPKDEKDFREFRKRIAGTVFQEFGYLYLKDRLSKSQPEGVFLLSPTDVFNLYRRLYPERALIDHENYGFDFGIGGVTVPDGFVVRDYEDRLGIDAVVEYKASVNAYNMERVRNQIRKYKETLPLDFKEIEAPPFGDELSPGRIINALRPDIPIKRVEVNKQVDIAFYVPSNFRIDNISDLVRIHQMPIDSKIFGAFIGFLMDTIPQYTQQKK